MKKLFFILLCTMCVLATNAQKRYLRVDKLDGTTTKVAVSKIDSIIIDSVRVGSLVSVTDGSIAEWDNLPAEYVFSCTSAGGASRSALTSLKVYADIHFLNLLVEFDNAQITNKEWVPFHVYLDADNSDATGGYGDQWADANIDYMLEGAVFASGSSASYSPSVSQWVGEVGTNGWTWGKVTNTATLTSASQIISNVIEIQIPRTYIPVDIAKIFGVGVDIQQNWSSVGILPNAASGKAPKLKVTTDPTLFVVE